MAIFRFFDRLGFFNKKLQPVADSGIDEGVVQSIADAISKLNNIEIQADTINLNTDTLEDKIQNVYDRLGDKSQFVRITDGSYIASVTNSGLLRVETVQSAGLADKVYIADYDTDAKAVVDDNGRIAITRQPVVPIGATAIELTADTLINMLTDDVYTIPSAKTLYITKFLGSASYASNSSKVSLYYDPNGTGIGMSLIKTVFVNGNNFEFDVYEKYVGDGVKKIRLRREPMGGGLREVFGKFEGYLK